MDRDRITNLYDLNLEELADFLGELGELRFRAPANLGLDVQASSGQL